MKKIILIFLSIILLSGCDINYNIDISNNKISTDLDLSVSETDYKNYNDNQEEKLSATLYEYFDEREILAFDDMNYKDFYNKKVSKNGRSLDINYTYKYTYLDFYKSSMLNTCFEDFIVLNEDNYFYVKAFGKFNCYYDDTKINIKTDRKVINSNHDSYKDGVYTWNIDRDKSNNVNIIFQVDKESHFVEEDSSNKNNSGIDLLTIVGIFLGIGALVILGIIMKKQNK